MTQTAMANKYLKLWKKKLRLDDWNIVVKVLSDKTFNVFMQEAGEASMSIESTNSIEAATNVGSVHDLNNQPYIYARKAYIAIRKKEEALSDQEIEANIVHELLHIMLSYIVPYKTDLEVAKVEQVIQTLEEVLTEKRKLNGKTKESSKASNKR